MSDREIMNAKGFYQTTTTSKPSSWEYSDTKVVLPKKDKDYMPNQKLHRNVSFLKSAVRILGFSICWWSLDIGITLLILAEVIGIGEELV